MRNIIFGLALVILAACGNSHPGAASGCTREATHAALFSSAEQPDTITARAEGPSCAQATLVLTVRDHGGDPLWVFASTYYDMSQGGVPPEGAPPVSDAQMDAFLAGWANVTANRSGDLPAWREGAASLAESVEGFSYDTPFTRETYEMLRARNLPQLCYAAAVEASQCLVIDPASNAPAMIVAFGP